jgi:phosphoglycerol transferase MdoB-like AlkP superfamily enzyme
VATFFLVLFVQQVGGYTPIAAGLTLLPLTILMFLLSRRFGTLADRWGPHLFMAIGPVVAGVGLLLLLRTSAQANYLSQILPGVLVFGLGLSATVAPLTATVLGAVSPSRSGVASGVNNAVARVASLLAIAALGAVVSGVFSARLDREVAGQRLTPAARSAVANAKTKPLVTTVTGVSGPERTTVHSALVDSSVYAFRVGLGIGAGLAVLGGLIALVGIENPRRRVPCADCPGGALVAAPAEAGRTAAAEPATTAG